MALIKRLTQVPDYSVKLPPGQDYPLKDKIVGDEVTPEVGAHYWNILQGEETPEPEEEAYCNSIHKIYLNWQNAPASYLLERITVVRDMCKGTPAAAVLEKRYKWALGESNHEA